MVKYNKENLVQVAVKGEISPAVLGSGYKVKHDGEPFILPGVGGITYNVKIGDRVMSWAGDHVEPGVSIKINNKEPKGANNALNILSCIGNKAKVVSGDAKGAEGYVTGKHGGIEHVLVYFPDEVLHKLTIGDKIQIKAWGQGLTINDLPDIKVMNLSPELFEKMPLDIKEGRLQVPVVATIPPYLMGSGLGSYTASRGDYDLTTADIDVLKEYGLDKLRFGDIVALKDTDNRYGRCYRQGAISIGVVVHSNCLKAGHGPGITTIFTAVSDMIKPVIDTKANIANYLNIRSL
ncbi:DUF4438 domain-containing protein [Halothermothrix orenii]|uniref:DUF4438 domain-containing protein n=1 Tax=Halothermothrix orenii (strain H 168 / OCM 544 / DSM 9562) TaxID=373903 RepID=B8CWC4_HALOH|nr:DUF4438 domain-containing protein [Halothermothrix orenii]ACL69593.1 hypothetical protein Hore_08360 [Halothermothrix orenii H 168]